MVVVDEGGDIVLMNAQAERQFCYHRNELIGQKARKIVPTGFDERLLADRLLTGADALAPQSGIGIELIGRHKNGSEFPVEIMLSHIESTEGVMLVAAAMT